MEPQQKPVFVTPTSEKSRTIALVLCLFLGPLGAHQFYVGKMGWGLLYLFTFGVLGIGWIISTISILLGSFTDNVGSPLRMW